MVTTQIKRYWLNTNMIESIRYIFGHNLSCMPHGIKYYHSLIGFLEAAPILIGLDNILNIGTPGYTMTSGNHADFQTCQSTDGFLSLHTIWHQNIGIVFLGLMHNLIQITLISKTLCSSQMLAKAIIGEQNLLLWTVSYHTIWPMQHRSRYKLQSTLAQRQGIPCLNSNIILFSITASQPL